MPLKHGIEMGYSKASTKPALSDAQFHFIVDNFLSRISLDSMSACKLVLVYTVPPQEAAAKCNVTRQSLDKNVARIKRFHRLLLEGSFLFMD